MEDLCLLCRQQLCTSLTCYWAWGLLNVLVWSCQCQLRPSNRSQGFGNHKITWMGCLRTCWCLGRSRILCSLQPSPAAGLTVNRWRLLLYLNLFPIFPQKWINGMELEKQKRISCPQRPYNMLKKFIYSHALLTHLTHFTLLIILWVKHRKVHEWIIKKRIMVLKCTHTLWSPEWPLITYGSS